MKESSGMAIGRVGVLMDVTDEQRDKFVDLLQPAIEAKGQPLYVMADKAGVTADVLRNLARNGPYINLRATDLFKVVRFFKLDINEVADILGVPLPIPNRDKLGPLALRFEDLTPEQHKWLLGVIDVLLRGMQ